MLLICCSFILLRHFNYVSIKCQVESTKEVYETTRQEGINETIRPPSTRHQHEATNGLHLVQEFFIFTSDDYRKRKLAGVPMQEVEDRQQEFNGVLRRNLNNDLTASLTILHNNDTGLRSYLKHLNLTNGHKLKLVNIYTEPSVQNIFLYVNTFMIGKVVMLLHMDNVLGSGVELIDTDKFMKDDICYALTRTVEPGSCSQANQSVHCNYDSKYIGSHDAFVFSLKKKRPVIDFSALNFNGDSDGQENVLIWFFEDVLHYRVLNPCKVINIYHQHCSKHHTRTGQRVNYEGRSKGSHFTDQLF